MIRATTPPAAELLLDAWSIEAVERHPYTGGYRWRLNITGAWTDDLAAYELLDGPVMRAALIAAAGREIAPAEFLAAGEAERRRLWQDVAAAILATATAEEWQIEWGQA